MPETPVAGDVLVDETQILLTEVIAQVGEGLRRYGLSFEAERAGRYNIELRRVASRRYVSSHYPEKIGIEEGKSWPVLVVRDRVRGESVGGLIIREEERDSQVYSTHRFSLGRENSRGGEEGLLSGEVEERDNEWWIRNHDGGLFSLTPREGGGAPVKCLALLYQRKFIGQQERLMITPFSVALTREQLHWLEDGGSFPSLSELARAEKTAPQRPARSQEKAELGELLVGDDASIFESVTQLLGGMPRKWAMNGVEGQEYRVFWEDKQGRLTVEGKAHTHGYREAGAVTHLTHVYVNLDHVSAAQLTNFGLQSASNEADNIPVEIFFLKDGTIKVGLDGSSAKEIKDHWEKNFWLAVLAKMRVRREKNPARQ